MKTDETDIPTKQNSPPKSTWLQSTHENCGWTQSDQSQTQSRPPQVGSLRFTKEVRLRTRRDFQRVVREGKRLVGRFLCIDYKCSKSPKLGISASKKYGSSPERNRFKRLVREAFRHQLKTLPPYEINIVPRQLAKKAFFQDISEELKQLLKCN